MVLQDTWLRSGTHPGQYCESGKPDATDEEIIAAAKGITCAQLYQAVCRRAMTPMITEDGGNLSQGQKQLLCIARVMLCLPPMLILG